MASRTGSLTWIWILHAGIMLTFSEGIPAEEQEARIEQQASKAKRAEDVFVPFTISVATTRITKPIKPDGTVDYAAVLNAQMSEGVTPENNAGVLLMAAIGAEEVPEAHREAFFKALGVPVPEGEGTLVRFGDFVEEHLKVKQAQSEINIDREPYWNQQTQATERPWSRKELPLVSDWLDTNADALKTALDATQRPRLFIPILVSETEFLISGSLPLSVRDFRELAWLLTARAMLALHDGQIAMATECLLACHRLTSLMGQQPTLIDALVSYGINAIACEGDLALAVANDVSGKQLAAYRAAVESLPPFPKLAEKFDLAERYIALNSISNVAVGKLNPEELGIRNEKLRDRLFLASVDWDSILKRFNKEYDNIAASLRQPTHASRQAAISQLANKLEKEILKEPNKPKQFALIAGKLLGINPPREEISRSVGNLMLAVMAPAIGGPSDAELRANTRRDLTILALTLAEYQREHGNYPDSLTDLSPKYLRSLPQDRFTDKPLKYQRQEAGYLLYSVGANGQDDQGVLDGDEADDIAIRVPKVPL